MSSRAPRRCSTAEQYSVQVGNSRLRSRPRTHPSGAVRAGAGRRGAVRPDRRERRTGAAAAPARGFPWCMVDRAGQQSGLLLGRRGRRRGRPSRRPAPDRAGASTARLRRRTEHARTRCETDVAGSNWPSSRPAMSTRLLAVSTPEPQPRGRGGERGRARRACAEIERPTAVFAANDLLAIGMLQGFVTAGLRVPRGRRHHRLRRHRLRRRGGRPAVLHSAATRGHRTQVR